MSGRWLRLTRRPRTETRPPDVAATLTTAFLDLDHRQGIAQAAVAAAAALHPASSIPEEWESVAQHCYSAMAAYLPLTAANGEPTQPAAQVARHLAEAAAAVDAFYSRHRYILDNAIGAVSAAATAAAAAATAARTADERLAGIDAPWRDYPSVHAAHLLMQSATAELSAARNRSDLIATQNSSEQLRTAAAALNDVLDLAPGRAEEARRAVTSVRTRLEALKTRTEGISAAVSTLLREFHADSSADLLGNEHRCRVDLNRAEGLLQQAETAARDGDPETALNLVGMARTVLATAAEHVDAPAQRLALLRSVRSDPQQDEQRARFRLRDAQRLAVDRGAQAQWGAALDAQALRIDRIVATLSGRHPDYWRYHFELNDVAQFVAGIVARIRQESAR